MINPYSSYILGFSASLFAYGLGWSELYPTLSLLLFAFLIFTIFLHFLMSLYWKARFQIRHVVVDTFFNPVLVTIFIYLLWIADFIYEGGIPLVKILLNEPYNYRQFGVPSLHVFTVTFASFFTVFLFNLFLATGRRTYIYLYIINLSAGMLIYSRAMMIFILTASVFIYLMSSPALSWRRVSLFTVGVIFLIYFFGILGSLRVSFEEKRPYDSRLFLDIGQASKSFRESNVPNEFFWSYIYLSSPLANLQQNVNTFQVPAFSVRRLFEHINNEMVFDFISKRMNRVFSVTRAEENTIPKKPFNVSTVYSRSYSYQGWAGMYIMAAFVLALPWIYIKILPQNRYYLSGLAILNTMYLFLFYDNTIRFTGLGFQLAFPFALPMAERVTLWFQKRIVI